MEEYYREFSIHTDGFHKDDKLIGHIAKIIIMDSKRSSICFAFAVDLMSITKYTLVFEDLLEKALNIVKKDIDLGEFEALELTYEYRHPGFIKVNKPKWWKSS